MSWQEPRQLVERFAAVGRQLRRLFPHWRLGRSYSGFGEALAAQGTTLVRAVVQPERSLLLADALLRRLRLLDRPATGGA